MHLDGPTVNHAPDWLVDHAELFLSIQSKQQEKKSYISHGVEGLTVAEDI